MACFHNPTDAVIHSHHNSDSFLTGIIFSIFFNTTPTIFNRYTVCQYKNMYYICNTVQNAIFILKMQAITQVVFSFFIKVQTLLT